MAKYQDLPMSQRLDRIGELLAKGVYLYTQKQKEVEKGSNSCDNKDDSQDGNASASSLGERKPQD